MPKAGNSVAVRLLGLHNAPFVPLLIEFNASLRPHEYRFMAMSEFARLSDPSEALRIYWTEMLYRAHVGAAISLLRHHRWLTGALSAAETPNFPAFASCLRGFLESVTDALHSLTVVAPSLAEESAIIRAALSGSLPVPVLNPELENLLIHFSHGRKLKKGDVTPESHKAKPVFAYNAAFVDDLQEELRDCYGELCEITHPAAASVLSFLSLDEEGAVLRLSPRGDDALIISFVTKHLEAIEVLLQVGVNTSLAILKVLNHLPLRELHTPFLDTVSLDALPAWKKIESELANPCPVPTGGDARS